MSQPPAYELHPARHYCILEFTPGLEAHRFEELEQIGQEIRGRLEAQPHPVVLVDLTRLEFIGSAAVALLIRLWKLIQEREGGMVVVNSSSVIQSVLEIAGLSRVWTIVGTREEAQRVLSKPPYRRGAAAETFLLAVLGWVAAAGSIGLILIREKQLAALDPELAQTLAFGTGAAALIAGLIAAVREQRHWRLLGILLVLISVAAVTIATLGAPLRPPA